MQIHTDDGQIQIAYGDEALGEVDHELIDLLLIIRHSREVSGLSDCKK